MACLFLFCISVIGLTNILVHSKILDDEHLGFRSWLKKKLGRFGDVLDCYECTGFWAGLINGLLLMPCSPMLFLPCAFAGAAIGHFYSTLVLLIESKVEYVVTEPQTAMSEGMKVGETGESQS